MSRVGQEELRTVTVQPPRVGLSLEPVKVAFPRKLRISSKAASMVSLMPSSQSEGAVGGQIG